VQDENRLTNAVFQARHPELGGRPLRAEERALAEQWHSIRDEIVRPLLRPGSGPSHGRPRTLSTPALRAAWRSYLNDKARMEHIRILGWNTPVNPETKAAWFALEQALSRTGYHAHRAFVFVPRNIGNTKSPSLHAYGLAIDIDHKDPTCNLNRLTPDRRLVRFATAAEKPDRCKQVCDDEADTVFTSDQVAAVESIQTVDGHQVFAWGGRWGDRKDTMHFQINVTPEELRRGLAPSPFVVQEASPFVVQEAPPVVVHESPPLGRYTESEQFLGLGSLIPPIGSLTLPRWLTDRLEKVFRDRAAELRHLITHYAGVERAFWEAGGGPRLESDPGVLLKLREYATAAGAANPVSLAQDFAADQEFWSAAFVCHVFRKAGVGRDEFHFDV
jgi:hypothetical protein